jgi:hypothetical protein
MRGSALMAAARAGSFTLSDIAPTRFLEAMRRVLPAAVQMSEAQIADLAIAADAIKTVRAFLLCARVCLCVLCMFDASTSVSRFLSSAVSRSLSHLHDFAPFSADVPDFAHLSTHRCVSIFDWASFHSTSQAALCVTIADRIGITDGIATTAAEFAQPNPDRMFCLLARLMVIDQGMVHMLVN